MQKSKEYIVGIVRSASSENESSTIVLKNRITEDDYIRIEKAVQTIEDVSAFKRWFSFVELNQKDFIDFLNRSKKHLLFKSHSWDSLEDEDVGDVYLNANRLFLNYLSSVRTFQDHAETFFHRKFGKDSNEFQEFKETTAFHFDNIFAYRFFVKLRNFSQHVGLPIHDISFKTERKGDRELHGFLAVEFNREKLLNEYSGWGKVKEDLQSQKAHFDVGPLIFDMTESLRSLQRSIINLYGDSLRKAIILIAEITKECDRNEGKVFIGYDLIDDANGNLSSYSSMGVPFGMIDFIETTLKSQY